ncbi:hypothetical protein J2S00_000903 [Caldalkalibacillus uzonensis]|uniref:YrzI family small protein n=1 Tax=Caldalkalibacillus uzonensis TaxID=353224 RepID=A0ABU0CNY0_9BACI|nr:hypothetical protein [Caldalkalibacillus uzonensis]MDQ0338120.1 hypothetical protein [Caldalkalibacillus uzonensis]
MVIPFFSFVIEIKVKKAQKRVVQSLNDHDHMDQLVEKCKQEFYTYHRFF